MIKDIDDIVEGLNFSPESIGLAKEVVKFIQKYPDQWTNNSKRNEILKYLQESVKFDN